MGWAEVYPVLTLDVFKGVLRKLTIGGGVVVEPKYDGVLVVAVDGKLYSETGRPLSGRLLDGLRESGYLEQVVDASRERVVLLELFGRRITPHGYHRFHPRDYDVVVLDTGRGWPPRLYPPEDSRMFAEEHGLPFVEYEYVNVDGDISDGWLAGLLRRYVGWEGCAVKFYSWHGHKLPGRYKRLGAVMVKVRWATFGRRYRATNASGEVERVLYSFSLSN